MQKLSKKEKKHVSKLIKSKLESMGVKDEITYIKTNIKRQKLVYDKKGHPITEKDKNGVLQPKIIVVDMVQAMNVMRRTIRELRNKSMVEVNQFLELQISGS